MNKKMNVLQEYWDFIRTRKNIFLIPLIIILLLVGVLMVLAETSAVAPFIYAIF